MRIAFYAPMKAPTASTPSGDRHIARLMMTALARGKHQPELISRFSSRDGRGDRTRQGRLSSLGVRLAARLIRRLRNRPAGARPEAWLTYHLYHKAPDWLGPAVTAALGIPYYLAEASSAPKQANGPWAIGYQAANTAIAAATGTLVLNPNDRECLRALLDKEERLFGLDPFLDHAPFAVANRQRTAHQAELRRHLSIPVDRTIILAVGMMRSGDKQASYDLTASALSLVETGDCDLVIVGDGPQRNAVMSRFGSMPNEHIHALGALPPDKMPAIYAASDVLLWPAVREAIGMSILEAQAAGLPVVAGHAGAIPKIVVHGATGFLSPVGQVEPLAENLQRLLNDQNLRDRMARSAVARVADRHTLAHAATTMNAMFAQTMHRH